MNLLLAAWNASDGFGKFITFMLLLFSISALAVCLVKRRQLKNMKSKNSAFLRKYAKQAHPAILFVESEHGLHITKESPVAQIYIETMRVFLSFLYKEGISDGHLLAWKENDFGPDVPETVIATVKAKAEGTLSRAILTCESRMSVLSGIVSLAPSLGLLGTVWGIMSAFMQMVSESSTILLSLVAPGIAGALLTTVAGLLVAIFFTPLYNLLADQIRSETVEMEAFTDSILADLSRLHLGTSRRVHGVQPMVAPQSILVQASPMYPAPYPPQNPMPGSMSPPSPADRM